MDIFPPSPQPVLVKWMVDTNRLWPEATQTRQLETVASRALAALLTDEERAGVLKYFHVRDAKMALVSQLLKHLVVARCTGVPWRETVLARDTHGKPVYYKDQVSGGLQPVIFNISHQAGLVVLAAVYGGEAGDNSALQVGIDVVSPTERRTRDHQMIAEESRKSGANSGWAYFVDVHADVLAPSEVRYLKQLSAPTDDDVRLDNHLRWFYGLWCLREAYVKMTGEALLAEWLKDLEFRSPVPNSPVNGGDDGLRQGDLETDHDIRFRGVPVGASINVCLRSIGRDFMVCTALRATPGRDNVAANTSTSLGLPAADYFDKLQMDDILDFVERSDRT